MYLAKDFKMDGAWAIYFLKASIATVWAFIAPIHLLMFAVFFVIMVDLLTGVWAAKHGGKAITSRGLRKTIVKIFLYNLAVLTGWLIEMSVTDLLPIVKLIGAAITFTELFSVLENIQRISGTNIFKKLIDKLGDQVNSDKD